MSKIGIIFAMKEEIDALKKYLVINNEVKYYDLVFYEGTIEGKSCVLVECGVGKVNAARTTQVLIDKFDVDKVINIGVAGGVDSTLSVGDIIIGEKLVQHDFDITPFDHEKGYIPNVGVYMDADKNMVDKAISVIKDIDISYRSGVIASGDIFCTLTSMSEKINHKFNALCTEMEGAAVSQVCVLCGVPFLVIRSISDVVNNDNVVTYEEFVKSSSEVVADFMKNLISNL